MIDFIVYDMTHLRYFSPFAASLSRLGFKTRWLLKHSSEKYNSIFGERVEQVRLFAKQAGCSEIDWFTGQSAGELAVTVETGTPADRIPHKYQAVLSMQHGFDYVGPDRQVLDNVLYVMWDQSYVNDHIEKKAGKQHRVPHVPVPFWVTKEECRQIAGTGNFVTVFYPEKGLHHLAHDACRKIISLGYTPIVKQRRKNQPVPQMLGCKVVYDDIWQPSESIVYPVLSDFCVGFGTSAYTDAVAAGLTFVDCPSPIYSQSYVKPSSPRFLVCSEGEIEEAVCRASSIPSRFVSPSNDQNDHFVSCLMEEMHVQRT